MKYITAKIGLIALIVCIGVATLYFFRHPKSRNKCKYDDSYFPTGILGRWEKRREFIIKLYSAMMEAPLVCQGDEIEVYRFLFTPPFDPPISVRIGRDKEQKYIVVKQLSSTGEPLNGAKDLRVNVSRVLTEEEWLNFQERLQRADFWYLPVESGEESIIDGAGFMFEGKKGNQYRIVKRVYPVEQNLSYVFGYLIEIS